MKNSLDISLLEGGDLFKKGCSFVTNNIGRVVASITFIIAALVLFTDISFCDFSAKDFGTLLLLMLIASYISYFSLEEAGEKLGEDSSEYKSANEEYLNAVSLVGVEHIERLRKFCGEYARGELEYRRESMLISKGYTKDEYNSYKAGGSFDKRARRVFKRVERQKIVSLDASSLLSREKSRKSRELENPESTKLLSMILKLIPSTVCMSITISVVLSAKETLDAIAIIDGLLKLSSLIIIGFKGYAHGYTYVKHKLSAWLVTKSRLLRAFLKEEGLRD